MSCLSSFQATSNTQYFPFYIIKNGPLFNTWGTLNTNLRHCGSFPFMTDVPECLGGAVPEPNFSLQKINTVRPRPGFQEETHTQRPRIRGRGTILAAGTAAGDCHYFQKQLWQNCTSVSLGLFTLPFPFESSMSEADLLTNDFSSHTSFRRSVIWKSSFRSDLLLIQFRNSSSIHQGIVGVRFENEPPIMIM